jgi:hypothetical protein
MQIDEIASSEEFSAEKDFISIPIGRTEDGRAAVNFSLGNLSVCYHAFIMGVAGMGKTSLLNNLIVQIAEQFTSRDIHLYLMGNSEFQIFDTHPNCKRIYLDNFDPNANLQVAESLLLEFQASIAERVRLFKGTKQRIRDIGHYNSLNPDVPLPRIFLIIEECQCLLTGKSSAGRIADLLTEVVKYGCRFGAHLIMSTQSLGGLSVDKELMSQIGLRIGFKLCYESDCAQLLEFGNTAPRALDKFQVIYNANYGLKHANVFAYTDHVGDSAVIRARINKVLAAREPALILKPQIAMKDESEHAQQDETSASTTAAFDSALDEVKVMLERERLEDEAKQRTGQSSGNPSA